MHSIFLLILSLLLLYFDAHWQSFSWLRTTVSAVITPIQYCIDWPVKFVADLENSLVSNQKLSQHNEQLQAENLLLQAKVQRIHFIEQENSELRDLLKAAKQLRHSFMATAIITFNINNSSFQATIDKGKKQGVFIGQPVLDAYGIVGQVYAIDALSSTILLINDPKSAIPVANTRNGLQSIAIGAGHDNALELINVIETADIKVGDVFVASGLGQRFPLGYPLGVVGSIEHNTGRFAKVDLIPSAHLYADRHLLLVWPEHLQSVGDKK